MSDFDYNLLCALITVIGLGLLFIGIVAKIRSDRTITNVLSIILIIVASALFIAPSIASTADDHTGEIKTVNITQIRISRTSRETRYIITTDEDVFTVSNTDCFSVGTENVASYRKTDWGNIREKSITLTPEYAEKVGVITIQEDTNFVIE